MYYVSVCWQCTDYERMQHSLKSTMGEYHIPGFVVKSGCLGNCGEGWRVDIKDDGNTSLVQHHQVLQILQQSLEERTQE